MMLLKPVYPKYCNFKSSAMCFFCTISMDYHHSSHSSHYILIWIVQLFMNSALYIYMYIIYIYWYCTIEVDVYQNCQRPTFSARQKDRWPQEDCRQAHLYVLYGSVSHHHCCRNCDCKFNGKKHEKMYGFDWSIEGGKKPRKKRTPQLSNMGGYNFW